MDFGIARRNMIRNQISGRVRNDRVIAAMLEVPRHLFVDAGMRGQAYSDNALPLCQGQTISQPLMVATMTELLCLQRGDKVLEIGTGSGYQAAVLAWLTDNVYSIERHQLLAETALRNLSAAGFDKVQIRCGDGTLGWPEASPFDKIIVTAGAPSVPKALFEQLKEGGRMIIPVGNRVMQSLKIIDKVNGEPVVKSNADCVFVPLLGQEGWRE